MKINSKQILISALLAGVLVGCGSSSSDKKQEPKQEPKETKSDLIIKSNNTNADFTEIGKNKLQYEVLKTLNYDKDVQDVFIDDWNSEDGKDNYIRGFDYKNNKLAVASVYHNALVVFDNEKHGFSTFAALEGAAHGKLGVSVDGTTQASENWLNQVKFDDSGEYIYALVKPKYIGRFLDSKSPDKASYGLYKVRVGGDLKVEYKNAEKFINKQIFAFDTFNNGNILTHNNETGEFFIYDKNLNEISKFNIKDSFRFDLKNDKLVVLVKGNDTKKSYIAQFNAQNGQQIGDKHEYNHKFDTYSLFELTNQGDKLLTYYLDENHELCSYNVANFAANCTDFGKKLNSTIGVISPNDKFLALTRGKSNNEVNIINIENKPFIQGQIPSSGVSYGISFINDETLVFANERREIKEYKISNSSEKFTQETKFKNVVDKIFNSLSKDINNIEVYEKTHHDKKYIAGDLNLLTNIDGINITYTLSAVFNEYINDKGAFIKIPAKKISGEIKAEIKMFKDNVEIKSQTKTSSISIMPKGFVDKTIFKDYSDSKSVNEALNDARMDVIYSEIASKKPFYTQNGVKDYIKSLLGTQKIKSLKFVENKITFLMADNTEATYEYTFAGQDGKFYQYQTKNDAKENVKYIYTTKPHKDAGSNMEHFHLKYSNYGFEYLKHKMFFPTFATNNPSLNEMITHYQNEKDELADNTPTNVFNSWEGSWNSLANYIDNTDEEISKAFDELKKFRPNLSILQIKQILKSGLNDDIKSIKITKDSNEFELTLNDNSKKNVKYQYDFNKGWVGLKPKTTANNIIITIAHGNPSHFHFKSGSQSYENLIKQSNVPTFFKNSTPLKNIAEEIEEFGKYFLKNK